jgi:hypothetical protein
MAKDTNNFWCKTLQPPHHHAVELARHSTYNSGCSLGILMPRIPMRREGSSERLPWSIAPTIK